MNQDKNRKQKKWILIIMIILTAGFVSMIAFRFFGVNREKTKYLKYRNYSIEYLQYTKGEKYLYPGHYLYNDDLLKQAYMKLANRLLDEYLQTKDSSLPKEILQISNDYNLTYGIKINNFDSLIIDRKNLLDTMILID